MSEFKDQHRVRVSVDTYTAGLDIKGQVKEGGNEPVPYDGGNNAIKQSPSIHSLDIEDCETPTQIVACVVEQIEKQNGEDCDVTAQDVLTVLRAERVELSIEEVSRALAAVI